MANIETIIAETWLYATLKADGTLAGYVGGSSAPRIYSELAPQGAAFPYIVYRNLSGRDVRTVGTRVMSSVLYIVEAIAQAGGYSAVKEIARRLDITLDRKHGTTADGVVLSCNRERPFSLTEVTDGVQYRRLGGVYRILAQ